jgi:type II secretory pathway pseudopilin PulG
VDKLTRNISLLTPGWHRRQRGITLIEVLFSVLVIGIIVVGYVASLGTAVSTTEVVADANVLAALAFGEVEELRSLDFGKVPFTQTSDVKAIKKVPNYLNNVLPDLDTALFYTTGDLPGYPREAAADGIRAEDTTLKWVAERNLLTYGVSEGPDASGPENEDEGPGGSGGDEGPGGGGPEEYPEGYQFWMVDLGQQLEIARIVYDNRFNVHETMALGLDTEIHRDDVWQERWRVFYRESELALGEVFDPRYHSETLKYFRGGAYGSSGLYTIWDNWESPLYAGVLGIAEINTYADFDPDFHWPYVNEVEVYGLDYATEYVPVFIEEVPSLEDSTKTEIKVSYNNIIMYFPNYKNTGFDMGRRCYIPAEAMDFEPAARQDLLRVQIEFYPHDRARNTNEWMQTTWWQEDDAELSRYTTSFYRDRNARRDNLPLLPDLPKHIIYDNNEDFFIEYSVPGALAVRFHFEQFDTQPDPSSDYVEFYDKDGNLIIDPVPSYYGRQGAGDPNHPENWNMYGPWVPGDTIVIHFHSDDEFNSSPPELYGGFKADRVEIKKPIEYY